MVELWVQQRNFFCLEPIVHSIPVAHEYVNRKGKLFILAEGNSSIPDFYCAYYRWIKKKVKRSTIEEATALVGFIKHPQVMCAYVEQLTKSLLYTSKEGNVYISDKLLKRADPKCFFYITQFFSYKPVALVLEKLFVFINVKWYKDIAKPFIDEDKLQVLQEICGYDAHCILHDWLLADAGISDELVIRILDSTPSHKLGSYTVSAIPTYHPLVASYKREKVKMDKRMFKVTLDCFDFINYNLYLISEGARILIAINTWSNRNEPQLLDDIAACADTEYFLKIYLLNALDPVPNLSFAKGIIDRITSHPILGALLDRVVESDEHIKNILGALLPEKYGWKYGVDKNYLLLCNNIEVKIIEVDLNKTYLRNFIVKEMVKKYPELNIKTFKLINFEKLIQVEVEKCL